MNRRLSPSLRIASCLGLAMLALGGCATSQPRFDFVWPVPPEVARVRYVRYLQSEDDLSPSLGRRILRQLLPHGANAMVAAPTGIALSADEKRLLVSCGSADRIVVFDLEGRKADLFPFDRKQSPAATSGVAIDADDTVFVSDRVQNAIFVFAKDGTFLRKFGQDRLLTPTAIALDRKRQQLYVISGATKRERPHTVEVYSPRGEHIRTIGGERSEEKGRFNFPSHLAVAPNGDLYVSDMLNFRVQVFDPEGNFRSSFGKLGTGGAGAFDKIKGIGFDRFGNVYVADGSQGVHIFNKNLQPLLLFGNPPVTNIPGAIVVDSRNHIYVTDFALNRVHEFELINTTAEDSLRSSASAPVDAGAAAAPAAPATPAGAPASP